MEKKFWWFSKKNTPANDVEDFNKGYYGDDASVDNTSDDNAYGAYSDSDISDVSIALSGDPSKKEPLTKRTFTPESCTDSQEIVDVYKEGKVVVICIEELDKPNFLRLFDYLMGAVQALDGELRRVDRDTVVLLPYGADEDVDIDELEEDVEDAEDEEEYEEETEDEPEEEIEDAEDLD